MAANACVYDVRIPRVSDNGLQFGKCMCGIPKGDGIPCRHMVVLAKGGHINDQGLTRLLVMPYWLSSTTWHKQFPEDCDCRSDISIMSVKNKYQGNDLIHYCPQWAVPKKAGHPKKDAKRSKGVMDIVAQNKRRKIMWCEICHKFNHNTRDCFKNPANFQLAPLKITRKGNLGKFRIGAILLVYINASMLNLYVTELPATIHATSS
jgi:hypothetical protein